jgi:hypothetical protein
MRSMAVGIAYMVLVIATLFAILRPLGVFGDK